MTTQFAMVSESTFPTPPCSMLARVPSPGCSGRQIIPATLLARTLILWRDASGQVHAWKDLCIIAAPGLSKGWIANDTVVCPYHGWRYDGSAKCVLVPRAPDQLHRVKARAFPHTAEERYGMVWYRWVSRNMRCRISPMGRWEFSQVQHRPYFFKATEFRSVENFIDATHFPFRPWRPQWTRGCARQGRGLLRCSKMNPASAPAASGFSSVRGTTDRCRSTPPTPTALPSLVAYFSKQVEIADSERKHLGKSRRPLLHLPHRTTGRRSHMHHSPVRRNQFGENLTEDDILRRQDKVFSQDKDIVETQRPERIPVDLRAEIHHRTDKFRPVVP